MQKKSITISSSGLKNISLNRYAKEDEITIVFGSQEIRMNYFFADFISPKIARIHYSDPTIKIFNFDDFFHTDKKSEINKFASDIFTSDIILLLHQISSGITIEMNEEQALKMRFLSIILDNEELFKLINENFPPDFNDENLGTYLEYIETFYHFSQISTDFDFSSMIDYISSHFYAIDPTKFLKLTRSMQYSIISNPHLLIKSEDTLLDIVQQIIKNDDQEYDKIENITFLEQIEFTGLSEQKLKEFLCEFDYNEMTNFLWKKLYQCFFIHFNKTPGRIDYHHSIKKYSIEYDENSPNRFEGIIHHLTDECGGNVNEKGIVKVSTSSFYNEFINNNLNNCVDFSHNFSVSTENKPISWLLYDFGERKVHPSYYSLKTWHMPQGRSHLKNWVIEGSNSNEENDWKILDSRNNVMSLDYANAEDTFKIQNKLGDNDYFRFLRIRVTGPNSKNSFQLIVCNLEFFGDLI